MNILLIMSIIWIIFGVLGAFGIGNVPDRYRGTEYEKDYKRSNGISWLLLGACYFVLYWLMHFELVTSDASGVPWPLLIPAMPGLLYALVTDFKYKRLLKKSKTASEKADKN